MATKKPKRLKRISLYPLTVEEALKVILASPPMPKEEWKPPARKVRVIAQPTPRWV